MSTAFFLERPFDALARPPSDTDRPRFPESLGCRCHLRSSTDPGAITDKSLNASHFVTLDCPNRRLIGETSRVVSVCA